MPGGKYIGGCPKDPTQFITFQSEPCVDQFLEKRENRECIYWQKFDAITVLKGSEIK